MLGDGEKETLKSSLRVDSIFFDLFHIGKEAYFFTPQPHIWGQLPECTARGVYTLLPLFSLADVLFRATFATTKKVVYEAFTCVCATCRQLQVQATILLLQIYMIPYIVIGRRMMVINGGGVKGAIR